MGKIPWALEILYNSRIINFEMHFWIIMVLSIKEDFLTRLRKISYAPVLFILYFESICQL